MNKGYVATIQFLIIGIEDRGDVLDFFESLLNENKNIKDWSYLKGDENGCWDFPPSSVDIPDDYKVSSHNYQAEYCKIFE